ncbi:MAG: hypothetical protein A3D92_14440 [Bacteroidetes bacterium RIFCSPHIGHO2_02_FULL_44_7]|nr:MAG: hypothetical protein A3D92_14440 [Bacteroidetes bacterium RIFCSPHIGHO2_02_FULL_44_7]
MYTTAIKDWAVEDRPREKLARNGRNSLSDAELLAVLIRSGSRDRSAVDLARQILSSCDNSLTALSKLSVTELQQFKGIGAAKAGAIYAALEIARRRGTELKVQSSKIKSSFDAFQFLQRSMLDLQHEEFHVLFLNRGNQILAGELISKGGLSGTVADGKLIFHRALQMKASGIILAHNHPSGQLRPSEADLKLTNSLVNFGSYIDLKVLDHLIFCDNDYFSFADEGLII